MFFREKTEVWGLVPPKENLFAFSRSGWLKFFAEIPKVGNPEVQGCRIPGSGGAQAPPVFRTLSHKNAIKPKNLRF